MPTMKIIAENLESKEKRETEIASLTDSDLTHLETFHFPETKNPEKAVRRHIESHNVSADQKAQIWELLKELGQAVLQVGKHVLSIGRKIFDFVLHLMTSYRNLTIGLALGAVFGSLIAAIPIIGWVFGGLATVFLPLIGGFIGFREDLANKEFKRRVFDTIKDEAVEKTIEREVKIYEPLNTPVNSNAKNESQSFKSGLDRGISLGGATIKSMLVAQTESKFDKEAAEKLENLLRNVNNLDCLSRVGGLLLECTSSTDFLQKTSKSLN